MSTTLRNRMREVMNLAWQFVRKNGYTMSEALRVAWRNIKLRMAMKSGVVRFHFQKVDGSIREAFGTLASHLTPETKGTGRKPNDTLQVYYDTEKEAFRSFKKANLLDIA